MIGISRNYICLQWAGKTIVSFKVSAKQKLSIDVNSMTGIEKTSFDAYNEDEACYMCSGDTGKEKALTRMDLEYSDRIKKGTIL